jgi:hypothetical protein
MRDQDPGTGDKSPPFNAGGNRKATLKSESPSLSIMNAGTALALLLLCGAVAVAAGCAGAGAGAGRQVPGTITGLHTTAAIGSAIGWEWTNPSGSFQYNAIYRDGIFLYNSTNATDTWWGLPPSASYTIAIRSCGRDGCNATPVAATAATTPYAASGASYSGIHITDLQHTTTYNPGVLNATFDRIQSLQPDYNLTAIFDTGDIREGRYGDYRKYHAAAARTAIPQYVIAGNHDEANGDFADWDAGVPDGVRRHDYPFLWEDFAGYGLAWSGQDSLNATARAQMKEWFAAHPGNLHLVLVHAYLDSDGTPLGAGTDLRNALQSNATILFGHVYPGDGRAGNLNRQTAYNGSVFTEELDNLQDIPPYTQTMGCILTVHKNPDGSIANMTTADIYVSPVLVVNNTRVYPMPLSAAPASQQHAAYG